MISKLLNDFVSAEGMTIPNDFREFMEKMVVNSLTGLLLK